MKRKSNAYDFKLLYTKPIAVLGAGVSGSAVIQFLEKKEIRYTLYDAQGKLGAKKDFSEKEAQSHSLIVYSPGFGPNHPWVQQGREQGCYCISEIDLAALYWPGKIIAVTGSNGKTTLTQLLTDALNALNLPAIAVGNIGKTFIEACLSEDANVNAIAVCEISSFQAEGLQHFFPDVLFWTTFSENHLERHGTIEAYFRAKFRLIENLFPDRLKSNLFIGDSIATFGKENGYVFPENTRIITAEDQLPFELKASSPFYRGPQSLNICLAAKFFEQAGYSLDVLKEIANHFKLAEHRLQKIAVINGVHFWDDSKSTTFASTLAALKTFEGKVHWVGGGKSKGGDIVGFAKEIAPYIQVAYLIGETASLLEKTFLSLNIPAKTFQTLEKAVFESFNYAKNHSVILLSPGFSSLDMFKDYKDRGKCFKNVVLSLKKTN